MSQPLSSSCWIGSGVAFGTAAASNVLGAVGTFAVLGNLFGILTVFQLLELANPSQPLLRRRARRNSYAP